MIEELEEQWRMIDIKTSLENAERMLDVKLAPSREKALAMTKLEEAFLWAQVAIEKQVKAEGTSE
jgi:hypothetical protein